MPQLDFVTYFPQSFWFNSLFWVSFFYFLYTVFPLISLLMKWRSFLESILFMKRKKFNKLLDSCVVRISKIFLTFSVKVIDRVGIIQNEQKSVIFKHNKVIYLIYFRYLIYLGIF